MGGALAQERIAGTVALDDGFPPVAPIRVELSCGDRGIAVGEANSAGLFLLTIAEDFGDKSQCLLRASQPGYRSAAIALTALPERPEIPSLTLYRNGKSQGQTISPTVFTAGKVATEAFYDAIREMRKGREANFPQAAERLRAAVAEEPQFAAAWYELGRIYMLDSQVGPAREALRQAVDADPWFVSPYEPLLMLELALESWPQVRGLCDRLLKINPNLAGAQYYRGLAAIAGDDRETAQAAIDAIEAGMGAAVFPELRHLRGLLLETAGDPEAAAVEYRGYLEQAPEGPAAALVRGRLDAIQRHDGPPQAPQ